MNIFPNEKEVPIALDPKLQCPGIKSQPLSSIPEDFIVERNSKTSSLAEERRNLTGN
jgi:hypothetical protein